MMPEKYQVKKQIEQITNQKPTKEWRYPAYRNAMSHRNIILPTSYVEWRYYSIIDRVFHGIVGMSLLNPENHFSALSEGGFLVIVTGILDSPQSSDHFLKSEPESGTGPQDICRMHLFPTSTCRFNEPDEGALVADDGEARLSVYHTDNRSAIVELDFNDGMSIRMSHTGIEGTEIPPVTATDLRVLPGGHWTVFCPSPIATTSGSISVPGRATAEWNNAPGYYEHSFGIQPLPLMGWDFMFAPDPEKGQGLVLQTYKRSRELRFIETFWTEEGGIHYERFNSDELRLERPESAVDPVVGVRLPIIRRIMAQKGDLKLTVTNRIVRQIPLLRPEKFIVRHFFISEQISFTDWKLIRKGKILAEGIDVPSGGELAHFRCRNPTPANSR